MTTKAGEANGSTTTQTTSSTSGQTGTSTDSGGDAALRTQIAELTSNAEALSRQVSELQGQVTEKDRQLSKWQKKGKAHDATIDKQASEGDTSAWEAKLQTMRDEHADEIERLTGKIKTLETEQRHDKVISRGIAKAAEYFTSDSLPLIQLHIERNCDIKDGQVVVKDDKGEVRYSGREPMSMDDYLKELAAKYPSCAKASGQAGGDSGGRKTTSGASGGTSYTPEEVMRANPAQQAEMVAKGDVASARNFLRAVSSGGRK